MKTSNILFETKNHFIIKSPKGGYEVYKNDVTHSVRVATIDYPTDCFERAKKELFRREVDNDKKIYIESCNQLERTPI